MCQRLSRSEKTALETTRACSRFDSAGLACHLSVFLSRRERRYERRLVAWTTLYNVCMYIPRNELDDSHYNLLE